MTRYHLNYPLIAVLFVILLVQIDSQKMKIATWNVNSIRTRKPHVIDWLTNNSIDVLCLQETKVIDKDFSERTL